MKKKITALAVAGVGALALSGLAVTGSWAGGLSAEEPGLRTLNSVQGPQDALPAVVVDSEHLSHLIQSSSRALDADGENKYWTVLNTDREICLVSLTPDNVAGTTCADPRDFNRHGMGIQVLTLEHAAEGYLVPDSVAPAAGSVITVNPFSLTKERSAASELNLSQASGTPFELRVLPAPTLLPGK